MDIKLREIAGKAAGTYFIVTDNSAVPEIEQTSNLRLFFINTEKGPINTIVLFKKGDIQGFNSVFGKILRKNEKQGNFSVRECTTALTVSGIAVINLRVFDSTDKTNIFGTSPNKTLDETKLVNYTKLFNTNGFWTVKPKNLLNNLVNENLLNIGNVGTTDVSFFVTVSNNVSLLTAEGEKTLLNTELTIEDFPALSPDMLVKDTFVDVWIFNNNFDTTTVSTNKYYGQLFNQSGLLKYNDLSNLSQIPESGFNRKITGSLIPNLKNEFGENISIDLLINNIFGEVGLIAHINDDLLELKTISNLPVINTLYQDYYTNTGTLKNVGNLFSHRFQDLTTNSEIIDYSKISTDWTASTTSNKNSVDFLKNTNCIFTNSNKLTEVFTVFENGIRVGDRILDLTSNKIIIVKRIESLTDYYNNNPNVTPTVFPTLPTGVTATFVILHLSDSLTDNLGYIRLKDQTRNGYVTAKNLISYKPRISQFTDGTLLKQKEILDMIVSPGIIKGLKNFDGIRYVVDCFKSYVEAGYKYQFGQLCKTLDESNKFIRAFVNEPFIEDLEKSTNPLFKQSPSDVFELSYIVDGGNPNYSTNFLTKFSSGAELCFFFGAKLDNQNEVPTASDVSNLFVQKTFDWDVVANASGYLDNVSGLSLNPDDIERSYMEKFRWNPIIKMTNGFTIYGNATGQKTRTALAQIHNSELLAYIKESLYNMSRGEAFKKGTYNEYLATEVEVKSFMDSLALSGAIQPNPIVICNASNNTPEISKQKIKLIHIEYFNIDALDKVVFDLNLK